MALLDCRFTAGLSSNEAFWAGSLTNPKTQEGLFHKILHYMHTPRTSLFNQKPGYQVPGLYWMRWEEKEVIRNFPKTILRHTCQCRMILWYYCVNMVIFLWSSWFRSQSSDEVITSGIIHGELCHTIRPTTLGKKKNISERKSHC